MRPEEPVRFDSRCLFPSADALTGSSSTKFRERATGIEPAFSAWERVREASSQGADLHRPS